MAFERTEFEAMMPQSLTVYPFLSFDNYGEVSYGTTGVSYACRLEIMPTRSGNQMGEEVVGNITAYVASTSTFNILDQYILPDGSSGIVRSIANQWDDEGLHHVQVEFGGSPGG
jgi:hypothetical protein